MFKRQLAWRQARDEKVRGLKEKLAAEGRLDLRTKVAGATAEEHVQQYVEYNRLVGEADGGKLLPEREYAALRAKAHAAERLFVTWRNPDGLECVTVGPDSRCKCGHSYKAHARFDGPGAVHCRVPGCRCECFDYLYGHGSQWPKCAC